MGRGGPGPLGAVGRALPDRRGGDQPAQGSAAPQVPHGRPHPRTAARAADPGAQRRPAAQDAPTRSSQPARRAQPGECFAAAGHDVHPLGRPHGGPTRSGPTTRPPGNAATCRRRRTTRSGRGRPSRCCEPPESGSRNCWRSATTASCNTGCPAPASSSRCCRSRRPRPTPSGCWSSARSWPTCCPPSSAGSAATPGRFRWSRPTTARSASGCRPHPAVPTPTRHRAPSDLPRQRSATCSTPPSPTAR